MLRKQTLRVLSIAGLVAALVLMDATVASAGSKSAQEDPPAACDPAVDETWADDPAAEDPIPDCDPELDSTCAEEPTGEDDPSEAPATMSSTAARATT
jgi:hypothetical protein